MTCAKRPAARWRRCSRRRACRSTPARWPPATCSWRCRARAAMATPSSPTRWPRARLGRWCIRTCPRPNRCCGGARRRGGYARERFPGRVVAVTGSVGKTTTKEMLRTILSAIGRTHAAVASYNNHWGLPLTLARAPFDAEYCVVEIGMNHAGEIAPLARLARPHVVAITAVEKAHIGFLGSIEAIADEKAEILRPLGPEGV